MAFFSDTNTQSAGLGARVSHIFANLVETLQRRKLARTTYAELAALSDRELADLGMVRADIRRVAREAAQGAL